MKNLFLLTLLSLPLAGQTIQGVVVDAITGAPIAGAYVSVRSVEVVVAHTDVAGHFSMESQNLTLQVARSGYVDTSISAKPGKDVTVRLSPAATISGKLIDVDGFPVEGAYLEASRYQQQRNGEPVLATVRRTISNDLGEFRLGGLAAGRYYLRISANRARNWDARYVPQFFGGTPQSKDENMVEVKPGEQRAGMDIRLLKFEGVTVRGRIEGLPRPASNQRLPMVSLESATYGGPNFSAMVQPDAAFVISHVTPGHYKLWMSTGANLQLGDLLAEMPLEVENADVSNLTLTPRIVQPVDVSGTFVVEGGATPETMLISLRPRSGNAITVHSQPDGSFVMKGLLPTHYDMQVMPEQYSPTYAKSARLGDQEVLQSGFDVESQPVGPMKITLGEPIVFHGTLIDAAGKPVAGQIIFFKSDSAAGGATSNSEGVFQAYFRFPGDYRPYALPDANLANDPDFLKAHEKDFPVVKIIPGDNPPLVLVIR